MKVQSNISGLLSSKLLRCWTVKPLWAGTYPAIQQSSIFSRKYKNNRYIYKTLWKICWFAGLLVRLLSLRLAPPTPYLILIRRRAGSSAAASQGTVRSDYCGSASIPKFDKKRGGRGPLTMEPLVLLAVNWRHVSTPVIQCALANSSNAGGNALATRQLSPPKW